MTKRLSEHGSVYDVLLDQTLFARRMEVERNPAACDPLGLFPDRLDAFASRGNTHFPEPVAQAFPQFNGSGVRLEGLALQVEHDETGAGDVGDAQDIGGPEGMVRRPGSTSKVTRSVLTCHGASSARRLWGSAA